MILVEGLDEENTKTDDANKEIPSNMTMQVAPSGWQISY